ncbi:hypothetical protein PCANC_01445 [Puccinia coronata f. sp. avenae]|uniref:Homeobox domain-containing protein n=1 Tax=Puccinia coronata f. sp. avenae TaxID=200324 RepID=A0A2N5W2Y9_9BASI|nr:hypothetical protein PCANC_01445 [Puccinia coronata f. sp. avenae]
MSRQASPSPTSQSTHNPEGSIYAHQRWNASTQQPQLYLARLPTVFPSSDNSSRSLQIGVPRPKRKRITPEQLEVLSNLFEYTDTPTFDLREAIGAKLGMSNREVQVWFQNRRAKVNRQRAPPNTQTILHERPIQSTSQRDALRSSHARPSSSSSELLLPNVSRLLTSTTDASCPTLSSAPLLPPFQPAVPGVNSIPDVLVARSQPATGPSSPQDITGSDRAHRPDLQLRSPSGSHRRHHTSTPGSPYSRKWLPRRAPDGFSHDHPASAPRRSSTNPQPQSAILPDYLAAQHPVRPRWSSPHTTRSRVKSHVTSQRAGSQHLKIGSSILDHSRQADPALTLNSHRMAQAMPTNDDNLAPQSAAFAHDFSPNQVYSSEANSSRSASPSSRHPSAQNQPSWQSRRESMPSDDTHPAFRKVRQEGEEHHLGCSTDQSSSFSWSQTKRSFSAEEPASVTPRSLFSSRYLPPLPNPVRPGPGSFPPPVALRVLPVRRDNSPVHSTFSSPPSGSEFRLPPLLNERHTDSLLVPPRNPPRTR